MRSQIPIHDRENNQDSESFLQQNAQNISDKCLKVLEILNTGKRLQVLEAANMGIASLPRRILDLKTAGFNIKDEWIIGADGKRKVKEYFLEITKRPTKQQVLEAFKNGNLVQSKLL